MEQWRDIPGYEFLYQASDQGRIRTCEGKITQNARYRKRIWKQRILKQKIQTRKNGRKDARVQLWKDGKEKTFLVARLVAMAWVDGYSHELTVNHVDGNSLNNRADNLEWLTIDDNIRHGFSIGLYPTRIPIRLKDDKCELEFDSMAEASRFLGWNDGYVSNCIKRGKHARNLYTGERYVILIGGGETNGQDATGEG